MMKNIEFIKAVAAGNDFIILDASRAASRYLPKQVGSLARQLCQRKLSVGADGLLLIEASKKADFKMRIFNPDGTEVNMCGNGARCVALYASKHKISAQRMTIETRAGILQAQVKQDNIKLKMAAVTDLKIKFDISVDGQDLEVSYVNTGVPHLVCFVQELEKFNVAEIGRALRYHSEFQPQGTNVDFVEVLDQYHIKVRTYERGVEQETLACGTGSVAGGIITVFEMQQNPQGAYKIKVYTQSGQTLVVYFTVQNNKVKDIFLEGKATLVYQAKFWEERR